MIRPLKAELKESLKLLHLPAFVAQLAQLGAVAASEGWAYEQYLLRLCEIELSD
jgi:hypothetical protein